MILLTLWGNNWLPCEDCIGKGAREEAGTSEKSSAVVQDKGWQYLWIRLKAVNAEKQMG